MSLPVAGSSHRRLFLNVKKYKQTARQDIYYVMTGIGTNGFIVTAYPIEYGG